MRKFGFIILLLTIVLSIANVSAADTLSQEELIKSYIENNKTSRPDALKQRFAEFKNLVVQKGSYEDIASGWLFFDENNDKLLIGSSGAVFCGYTMKRELLLKHGYDVIGFGGIFDDELIELLKLANGKKYKTILIIGGINDLNIRSLYNIHDIDMGYCITLNELRDEAKLHMIDGESSLYYVKIKPMTLGRDIDNELFLDNFNNMAKEINDNIELFGYKSYDIPFDTTTEFSEHYMHYNNVIVYETMFNAIR